MRISTRLQENVDRFEHLFRLARLHKARELPKCSHRISSQEIVSRCSSDALSPTLETMRRWSTWKQSPANLFDDYILGALLLYGAWRVGKDVRSGQRFLRSE